MGQKEVLWAWTNVSKGVLRIWCKGLMNILVVQYVQDKTGIYTGSDMCIFTGLCTGHVQPRSRFFC